MSSESGFRTIIARPDGGVSVLAASAKRRGAASVDALLSRAEAKAQVGTIVGRVKAGEGVPETRALRNAWIIVNGKVRVDLEKAREMKAEQWGEEGMELADFIRKRLLPKARILGQRDTVDRLNAALLKIEEVMLSLEFSVPTMAEVELATHKPDWPQLTERAK